MDEATGTEEGPGFLDLSSDLWRVECMDLGAEAVETVEAGLLALRLVEPALDGLSRSGGREG